MLDLRVCIYMCRSEQGWRAGFTHDPALDLAYFTGFGQQDPAGGMSLDIVSPFLPIGVAHYILAAVFAQGETTGWMSRPQAASILRRMTGTDSYEQRVCRTTDKITGLLKGMEAYFGRGSLIPEGGPGFRQRQGCSPRNGRNWTDADSESARETVLSGLRGRILFLEELEKCLAETGRPDHGLSLAALADTLQFLALTGQVALMPSLAVASPGQAVCHRCGGRMALPKGTGSKDGILSLYCPECSGMGEARLWRPLYAAGTAGNLLPPALGPPIALRGLPPLTPAQVQAFKALVEFIRSSPGLSEPAERSGEGVSGEGVLEPGGSGPADRPSEALVWAVTGAGKTEVVMGAMAAVLGRGGRVLYAAPRRDVVKELAPRLQAAFGSLEMLVSYGGSPDKYRRAPLTAATTHQVLRFYQQFDLVVLDEVDAFPYRGNAILQRAVRRSVKPGGQIIYLTATPDNILLARAKSGAVQMLTIPARHHGHPVPEPKLVRLRPFPVGKNGRPQPCPYLLQLLSDWVQEQGRQVFVFLPTVQMVNTLGPLLQAALRGAGPDRLAGARKGLLEYSHAGDGQREEKRAGFKGGDFPILVSTTIMERGVTVKKAHVLVLEADYERVFDEANLIQMAGRAGRSAECPEGEVVFMGRHITPAMSGAQTKIRRLNALALEKGFLRQP